MILVDTSVWIDYFNGHDNPYTDLLDRSLEEDIVAIGDLILLEILQGFTRDGDYQQAKSRLANLQLFEIFGGKMALKCAENYRKLRKTGITIRRTTDVIIATFCIEQRLPLLFSDKDFLPFVDRLGLNPVLVDS